MTAPLSAIMSQAQSIAFKLRIPLVGPGVSLIEALSQLKKFHEEFLSRSPFSYDVELPLYDLDLGSLTLYKICQRVIKPSGII
jgi:hypothetical protein